jgi:hypothetical protein
VGSTARLQFWAESDGPARSSPSTWLGSQAGSATIRRAGSGFNKLAWALASLLVDASSGPVALWTDLGWSGSSHPSPPPADWAAPRVGLNRIRCGSA